MKESVRCLNITCPRPFSLFETTHSESNYLKSLVRETTINQSYRSSNVFSQYTFGSQPGLSGSAVGMRALR
jgi:hypothetical protein